MKVNSIRYGRTFNTGNYENEKVEMEAELEDGDNPENTLNKLKQLVGNSVGEGVVVVAETAPPAASTTHNGNYVLVNVKGDVMLDTKLASEWILKYEEGAKVYADQDLLDEFITLNYAPLTQIHRMAESHDDPRVLERVKQCEERVSKLCNGTL